MIQLLYEAWDLNLQSLSWTTKLMFQRDLQLVEESFIRDRLKDMLQILFIFLYLRVVFSRFHSVYSLPYNAMNCVEMKTEVRSVYGFKQLILESLHRIAYPTLNNLSASNDHLNDCLDES